MTFIDIDALEEREKRPGWRGRTFDSPSMTFWRWSFDAGSSIHGHGHPQEEVWQVLEGRLEVTIAGETREVGPGMAAIVPAGTQHAVKALTGGIALVVDYPLRRME